MNNAFQPGQGVPASLVAGDFWTWRLDGFAAVYPSPEFALVYQITPRSGGAPVTLTATADPAGWVIQAAANITGPLTPGAWSWVLSAVRQADQARATLASGAFTLAPNPAAGADTRSQARRMLDAINATLEGRITADVEAYTIEGRSLTRVPFAELRATRARLAREVADEEAAALGRPAGILHRKVRNGHGH